MKADVKLDMVKQVSVPEKILVGKDILELMSGAMYVDPLNLFREYIQNSADSIDLCRNPSDSQIEISLDPNNRRIRILDSGIGLNSKNFADTMTAIGGSRKRAIPGSRGFRGIGRLAGLGFCRQLTFRSKGENDKEVMQIVWDCVQFKKILRDATYAGDLENVIREVCTITSMPADNERAFFEVTLDGVVRLNNDVLLNGPAVIGYLGQVAPVPFHPDFRFAQEIEDLLSKHGINSGYSISLAEANMSNNELQSVYRPYRNQFNAAGGQLDEITSIQHIELPGFHGDVAAVGWIADSNYFGAIPASELVKGIRLRVGNIQVGEQNIVAREFPESRFNSWSIGEFHVLSNRIIPNGRRDNFEEDVHYEYLLSQLQPHLKKVAQVCRRKSSKRQWTVRFNSRLNMLEQDLIMLESRSLSKRKIPRAIKEIEHGIFTLEEIVSNSKCEWAKDHYSKTESLKTRLEELSGHDSTNSDDPLAAVPYKKRLAFQEILALVYEVSVNKEASNIMIEKVLKRVASKYS